jgi:transposase
LHRYLRSDKTEPRYGTRPPKPGLLNPFKQYIIGRLKIYPELTAVRLTKEIIPLGYKGKYSIVKRFFRQQRPPWPLPIEADYEVSPREQAQVDVATFKATMGSSARRFFSRQN